MYQEEFLPVVFKIRFLSKQALPVAKWRSRIDDVLHAYVDQICQNDERMIGHIKALAQINERDFIKYSCISNSDAIISTFNGTNQDVSKINVIINSLVSDISENESRLLLEQACQALEKSAADISIRIDLNHNQPSSHHHHHHEGETCPICNGQHHH